MIENTLFLVEGVSVYTGSDNTVRVWNLQKKRQEFVLKGHTGCVKSLAIAHDNKYVVSGSDNNTVIVWNLQERRIEAVLEGHAKSISITYDNKYVIYSGFDKTVTVWNLQKKFQEAVLYKTDSENIWIKKYPEIDPLIKLI